ncbi:sensor histidine kinase [Halovivax limisalsi]|uniref:sensor histidine kinase n=1 Tax=Halovivax limisalsi TaxID=1453760 RepID=UPI001FFD190A|nr:ATP-binding protein [Halovivax limisalsi]
MTAPDAPDLLPAAVDTLPINMAILDHEGTILYTNRAWQEFGADNEIDLQPDTVGINYLEVTEASTSETGRAAAAGLRELLAGEREHVELEYPCHGPDARRWFLLRATPFTHDGDRYVVVAHSDITDRHEYEARLAASNERLEQFAYAASHDLREPLRMVTSYLDLLERRYADDLDEDAAEFIDYAVDGAERMKAMIEGLLAYSRVETRGDPMAAVDLDAVLEDVRRDLERRIAETGAEISADPLPTVEGDASQLRQVFQNLLDNAIEYSGDGPPGIEISCRRTGSRWEIAVTDDGIGIDPDAQERIFRVFERLHTHEEHHGSGIGLALCRRIVERHGGQLTVDSEPGEGTTFSFTLPAADDPEP